MLVNADVKSFDWDLSSATPAPKVSLGDQGVVNGSEVWLFKSQPVRVRGRAYDPHHNGVGVEVTADSPRWVAKGREKVSPRVRAAALYVEQAGEEQTSVASFAALTLRLMANAAPPALLDASLRAAQDEVRHARACARLA
eukprot:Hpha_TRINITY_DN15029_c5_g10::TRINITY_DN15029_c5_g10_i1::g.125584::m.125584